MVDIDDLVDLAISVIAGIGAVTIINDFTALTKDLPPALLIGWYALAAVFVSFAWRQIRRR